METPTGLKPQMEIRRVVSGGQTGVDRAALRAARRAGLEIGGWCPPGPAAEDGASEDGSSEDDAAPEDLPLRETPRERSEKAPGVARSLRTEWNVRDSHATLILCPDGTLDPGTEWTRQCAELYGRPLLELDPSSGDPAASVESIRAWLRRHCVVVLNVAGPSRETAPQNAEAASRLLTAVFEPLGPRPPFTTERLTLRRFTPGDGDFLFALDSDPEVMRYLSGGPATPRRVIDDQVLPTFRRYDEDHPAFGFFVAEERGTGESVGWISFRLSPDVPGEVSLGFRFERASWGRGYATEASRFLVELGFRLGVRRLLATTYEENRASRRVLEKLGMRLVRRFRPHPEELAATDTYEGGGEVWDGDDVEYELLPGDWPGGVTRTGRRPGAAPPGDNTRPAPTRDG